MELEHEMSTKIGPFEILSELSKSPTGAVYKANDSESGQTVALKAIQLSAFGESAAALEQALLAEAESTKALSNSNITPVLGAGEIEGQFCAAMEYVQGNSIATMLARKEGFSIWDLLDIGRQLCSGLDYVNSQHIVHHSLEPGKIMCGWDGTVRILGLGVSSVGNFVLQVPIGVPATLHYMSPEQVLGQTMDGRSNLFSLGAMFYEMVTERKAFDREDMENLRQSILKSMPAPPIQVNPKVHPILSDLIMKALAKDPAERYQNGRELLADLERCKEARPVAAKKPEAPKAPVAPVRANGAAQPKFVTPPAAKPAAGVARPAATPPAAPHSGLRPSNTAATPAAKSTPAKPAEKNPVAPLGESAEIRSMTLAKPASRLASPKAAAAAAGAGGSEAGSSSEVRELGLSNEFTPAAVNQSIETPPQPSAYMSSAVADEPQVETFEPQVDVDAPKIAVDPMMAEEGPASNKGVSFSEMTEMPPLKEVYVAPPPPPPAPVQPVQSAAPAVTVFQGRPKAPEKPKVQPREVAQKAIKEIKGVPPKLMFYALGAAGALILAIGIGVTVYIHSQNSDDDSGAANAATAVERAVQQEAPQPAPQSAPAPAPVAAPPAETPEPEAPVAERAASSKSRTSRRKAAPVAPVIVPGQLAVDSTPQGAQVKVDGKSDPTWVTPFTLTGLQPGQHSITVSKAGYSTDTRTVDVISGNRATTVIHLAQLMATLIVKSNPAGANIYVDGRDMGAKTPAQVSVDKGQHVVLVRMAGYIDETMNGQFALGQTFNFSPTLRPLGNADSIKTVGKMSRLFGGKGAQAGEAMVNIRTQPKGAQVAINQHLLEKMSPVEVELDPGNYVIDITMTGYAPVHKVITVDKGDKIVVDEVLQRQ